MQSRLLSITSCGAFLLSNHVNRGQHQEFGRFHIFTTVGFTKYPVSVKFLVKFSYYCRIHQIPHFCKKSWSATVGFTRFLASTCRGVINVKANKAAALPKFSDMLTLSQPRGEDYAYQLALPHQKMFRDYAPDMSPHGVMGGNLNHINSAPSNSKTEVTLTRVICTVQFY